MKFPDPIPLPEAINQARDERQKELVKVSLIGIALRFFIVLLELGGVALFESASLFMDAIATLVDISATFILIISLMVAARPPDSNHPFGHGRFEPIAGLQLSFLMIIVGAGMLFQQIFLSTPVAQEEPIYPLAWVISALAAVILLIAKNLISSAAEKRGSAALKADAAHFGADAITSLIATAALLAGSFFPLWSNYFDHAGGWMIACVMIGLGFRAARENLAQLMDRAPDLKYFEEVKKAALQVSGVYETEKIRIQLYGPDAHVDIDVEVDPLQSVEEAHRLSQKVRAEIQKRIPEVRDVTVHLEPYYPGDHT